MFVHYTDCWPTNHLYLYIWLVSTVQDVYNILHISNINPTFMWLIGMLVDSVLMTPIMMRILLLVVVLMLRPAPVANRTAPPRARNICQRGFHDITLLVTVTAWTRDWSPATNCCLVTTEIILLFLFTAARQNGCHQFQFPHLKSSPSIMCWRS